jgi:hypothetical protein
VCEAYQLGFFLMPNKHNADRGHHFGQMKFEVRTWASYHAGLRRRGSLTLWVTGEAIAKWQAPPRLNPGDDAGFNPSQHDGHIAVIEAKGRLGCETAPKLDPALRDP